MLRPAPLSATLLDLLVPTTPTALAVGCVVTAFAALLQGTVGIGFAMVCVPILSLVDPKLAPVPQLLVSTPMVVTMAWRERQAIELRGAIWATIGRVPGTVIGVGLLAIASASVLDLIIGAIVLLGAAIVGSSAKVERTKVREFATGVVSGVSALVSSIGGPPLALLYGHATGATLRATIALVFSTGAVITLIGRLAASAIELRDLVIAMWMMPGLLLGLAVSRRLHGRVEGRPLRLAVLAICGAAGCGLILRGATHLLM